MERRRTASEAPISDSEINAPFNGWDHDKMAQAVEDFIGETALQDDVLYLFKGAFLAQSHRNEAWLQGQQAADLGKKWLREQESFGITPAEHEALTRERSLDWSKWRQPWPLWRLVAICALGAAVQGWDESAVNGAQLFYAHAFNISDSKDLNSKDLNSEYLNSDLKLAAIRGLVNGAPYLCCTLSCWLNQPLNQMFGRRGTIFVACIFSAAFCLAQAFSQTWQVLFAFRFLLGLGIGPKSATIPIYAAECAPKNVRGGLVMMWQVFTAVGIMFGYASSALLGAVITNNQDDNIKWRLIIGSPLVCPIVLALYIYTQPESPRWLLAKAHTAVAAQNFDTAKFYYGKAFASLVLLRHTKLQAARDMFLISHQLTLERQALKRQRINEEWYERGVYELFSKRRNRRAVMASLITMFAQQFCGVNVIIYYSSVVFSDAQYDNTKSLLLSMGFGIINAVFALPAFWTIDTFGRRSLLLVTIPFLAFCQILTAIAFRLQPGNGQQVMAVVGMYLFSVAYSPGEGPVPFVYSAESMPLYIRDLGMGLVTSVNWFFNFVVAISAPSLFHSLTVYGTFLYYAAWCVILWFMIFLFVPETKGLSLEDLDSVFRYVSTKSFARYHCQEAIWYIKRKKGDKPRMKFENPEANDHVAMTYGTSLEMKSEPRTGVLSFDSER